MTTTSEIKVHKPGSPEAHKCMARNNVLYDSSGQPMASVYFVFPHLLTFAHPHFKKKKVGQKVVNKMRKIAKALAPLLTRLGEDAEYLAVFEPHKEFLIELDDEEICTMLNEACNISLEQDERGDLIGYSHAKAIFMALQRLDDDRFGETIFGPHYTYNDPDSYCGQHDIQFTYPGNGSDNIWGTSSFEVVFLQIHPGGDARNMAEGRFYVPEGIDEMTNLFDTLGICHAGDLLTQVEIPVEFPLEQWIKQTDEEAWDSIYREEVEGDDGRYEPAEVLGWYTDFKDGLCRVQLCPKGEESAAVEVYRCYDVPCWKGRDWWTWTPTGEIVGEMRKMWGVSATPWKPEEFQCSTGGYFRWEGPMPGTPEWDEMMIEHKLDPIEPRKPKKTEEE